MDVKKNQKVLLAIVAVAALGAGGLFYFNRDAGSNTASRQNSGRSVRKVRQKTAQGKTKKRNVRKRTRKKEVKSVRKERADRSGAKSSTRKTRGRKKVKIKKKKITPAA